MATNFKVTVSVTKKTHSSDSIFKPFCSLVYQVLYKYYITKPNKYLNALVVSTTNMTAVVIGAAATPEQSPRGRKPFHEGGQLHPVKLFNGPVMMVDAVLVLSETALCSRHSV